MGGRIACLRVGSTMGRVLPGELLSRTLSLSKTGIPQGHYGFIYRSDPRTVRGVPTGRTLDLDCYDAWKVRRVDDFLAATPSR